MRGWLLDEAENERVNAIDDAVEIVLLKRPKALLIEVPTANEQLQAVEGRKIYVLTMKVRTWSLDKHHTVFVKRYGFPLIPDFGGTAHAYCGDTLDAVIGDLLPWSQIPTLDLALRAYIIKSRVRDSSQLLLAQPYSPMLFRQGVQPGPHLLHEVLSGRLTPAEAEKAWKSIHDNKANPTTSAKKW